MRQEKNEKIRIINSYEEFKKKTVGLKDMVKTTINMRMKMK